MNNNENRMKGNRGEWGEPYVALHLLSYGKIYMSDEWGNKNEKEWLNIIDVIRHESKEKTVSYHYNPEEMKIDISVNNKPLISVMASEFLEIKDILAYDIRNREGRSFDVSVNVSDFLKKIGINNIKATSINKSDIFLNVSDPRSSIIRQNIGFSIKSKFGNNPTLFNTAPASGVVYKIGNMNDKLMNYINNLYDAKGNVSVLERCGKLLENQCTFEFVGFPMAARAKCEAFRENLELINPHLPNVIERILWNHFFEGEIKVEIREVVERIISENPENLTRPDIKYPFMIKAFLYASYCGMTASTLWNGKSEVNGGFITVDESGEVLASYAMESDAFKEYLYNLCYLEFPSTSKKHGNYAKVYKKDDEYYFNLNFQIRIR